MYFFLSTLTLVVFYQSNCSSCPVRYIFSDNYATTLTLLRTILCLDQISRASTFDRAVFFVLAGLGHVLTCSLSDKCVKIWRIL